jgi:hypothetical protein
MLIYNITSLVDTSVVPEWLEWLTSVHIPAIMATGYFERYQLVKLLDVDETQGLTYAVQFYAPDKDAYDLFSLVHAPSLEKASEKLWGEKCLSFRSLMEVVK